MDMRGCVCVCVGEECAWICVGVELVGGVGVESVCG